MSLIIKGLILSRLFMQSGNKADHCTGYQCDSGYWI